MIKIIWMMMRGDDRDEDNDNDDDHSTAPK